MLHLLTLLAFAILFPLVTATPADTFSQTTDYPPPNPGNLQVHDPNILEYNSTLYLFKGGIHVPIFKATNISGPWTKIGTVLDEDSIIPKENRTRPWAPTTVSWHGTFYCFYTISDHGQRDSAIGVASTTNIDGGSWTDHGALINTGQGKGSGTWPYTESNAIDAAFISDQATGKPYLTYGSFWHGIFMVPLTSDLLAVENQDQPDAVNTVYVPHGKVKPVEGSFMSYKAPYYYLWFSDGQCCRFNQRGFPKMGEEYKIRVGRSESVTGPFVDKDGLNLTLGGGTIVYGSNHGITYAPGGLGVLSGNDTRADILYYHYLNTSIGFEDYDAQLGWNYLEYIDGWPVARASMDDFESTAPTIQHTGYLSKLLGLLLLWLYLWC